MNDSNRSARIAPEGFDAIQKLDFKPNELARSLVMKRSNLIGVVVKDIGIPYMAGIIRGIEEIGKMSKFDILLSSSYGEEDSELDTVQFMFTKQVDGIILVSEKTTERVVDTIKEHKLPFLILDRIYEQSRINTVDVDYEQAVQLIIEFLESMGHTRIPHAGQKRIPAAARKVYRLSGSYANPRLGRAFYPRPGDNLPGVQRKLRRTGRLL